MKTIATRLAFATAAASMAFAPIAAQANTRASDSGATYSAASVSQPGTGRSAEGEALVGTSGILAIIAAALITAGVIILIDDDDTQSPGAN